MYNTKLATQCPQSQCHATVVALGLSLQIQFEQRVGKGVCNLKSWGQAEEVFHSHLNLTFPAGCKRLDSMTQEVLSDEFS